MRFPDVDGFGTPEPAEPPAHREPQVEPDLPGAPRQPEELPQPRTPESASGERVVPDAVFEADLAPTGNIALLIAHGSAGQQLRKVAVCAELGGTAPERALALLKHLAGSGHAEVREAVLAAARRIGAEIGTSRFLRYLAEWFDRAPALRLRVLADAVSSVLAERGEHVEPDAARSFWHHALGTVPPDELRSLAQSWLRTAAGRFPADRDGMLEPLVQSTRSDPHRIAGLWYASRPGPDSLRRGAPEDGAVTEAVHQLWTRLDEVDPIWAWE